MLYEGKRYKFCNIGSTRKWVDDRNIVVPVVMNKTLRKQAIEDGTEPEAFLSKKPKKLERVRVKKAKVSSSRKRKGSVTVGINLSSIIKKGEEDNDTK